MPARTVLAHLPPVARTCGASRPQTAGISPYALHAAQASRHRGQAGHIALALRGEGATLPAVRPRTAQPKART